MKKLGNWLFLIALVLIVAVVLGWLKCAGGFGLPGGGQGVGTGKGEGKGLVGKGAAGSDGGLPSIAVLEPVLKEARCKLRVDATGLTVEGKPGTPADAVAACQTIGEAEVRVAGDAKFGGFEALKLALEQAKIRVIVID
jgi:hypothetical protein